jgi:hypothetical protein
MRHVAVGALQVSVVICAEWSASSIRSTSSEIPCGCPCGAFTRLTDGFSAKWDNHAAMVAYTSCIATFGRVHHTLRCTPATEALLSDHVWSIEEMIGLSDRRTSEAA